MSQTLWTLGILFRFRTGRPVQKALNALMHTPALLQEGRQYLLSLNLGIVPVVNENDTVVTQEYGLLLD